MWEKIKSAAYWVYEWITILAASLVGLPSLLLELLSSIEGVNLTPLIGPELALKIVTIVAVAKAIIAFIERKIRAA